MLLLPSYVHLECPDSEPRRGPSSRQPDEVFAADVAGEQGGADLFGRTKVNSASHDHYSCYLQEAKTCVVRQEKSRSQYPCSS